MSGRICSCSFSEVYGQAAVLIELVERFAWCCNRIYQLYAFKLKSFLTLFTLLPSLALSLGHRRWNIIVGWFASLILCKSSPFTSAEGGRLEQGFPFRSAHCAFREATGSFTMPDQQVHEWMEKARHFLRLDKIPPTPRKIIVSVVGGLIFVAGIIMLVTPGPAVVLIPLGLLLLASEFKWAEEWAQKVLNLLHRAREKWHQRRTHG